MRTIALLTTVCVAACGGQQTDTPTKTSPVTPTPPSTEQPDAQAAVPTPRTVPNRDPAAVKAFIARAKAAAVKANKDDADSEYGKPTSGGIGLPPVVCQREIRSKKRPDSCTMAASVDAAAVILRVGEDCERCVPGVFIKLNKAPAKRLKVADRFDAYMTIAPGAAYGVIGSHFTAGPDSGPQTQLYRVDLDNDKTTKLANCAAPVLSPARKWWVCRDSAGDIYKLPVNGPAKLTLVLKVKTPKDGGGGAHLNRHGNSGLLAVKFVSGKMVIETTWENDQSVTKQTASWSE